MRLDAERDWIGTSFGFWLVEITRQILWVTNAAHVVWNTKHGCVKLVKNWVRPLIMSTFTLTVLLSLSSGYILTENAYRVFFPFSWEKGFKKPLERGSKLKWGVGWVKSAGDHEIFMYCFKDSGWIIFLQFFFNLETIILRHRIKHQKVLVYH